jgi:hypothetical protein
VKAVDPPGAARLLVDETRLLQEPEMARDRRPADRELEREGGDGPRRLAEQCQNLSTVRISERRERVGVAFAVTVSPRSFRNDAVTVAEPLPRSGRGSMTRKGADRGDAEAN